MEYKFAVETFNHNNITYEVVVTPELYEEGNVYLTGNFIGILIDPLKGTFTFSMTPDQYTRWEIDNKTQIHPELKDEIGKIIEKHFSTII